MAVSKTAFIILLFPAFLLVNHKTQAQKKIDGIGPFIINKTTTAAMDSLKALGYEFKLCKEFYCYHPLSATLIEHVKIDTTIAFGDNPAIPGHRKFYMGQTVIAGFELYNIMMDFYRDTLIKIRINEFSTEFTDALALKYGKPKYTSERKKVLCKNSFRTFTEEEVLSTWTFRNDRIEAVNHFFTYFDDKCVKKVVNFFSIADKSKVMIIEKEVKRMNDKSKQGKVEEVKKRLKDL